MTDSKSQTFTCPKCGAPQDYQGGTAATIQCPYCETTLIVPEALRTRAASTTFPFGSNSQSAGKLAEIKRLTTSGNKIAAIKLYREMTGVGLKEAKDAVEAIERGEAIPLAQTFQINTEAGNVQITRAPGGTVQIQRTSSTGCWGVFTVIIVLIVLAAIVIPILLSVGAFTMFAPSLSGDPTSIAVPPLLAMASPTPPPTKTPLPSPTPQFANVVSEFGGKGTGAGKMSDVRAIAVDNNGNIFVAEYLGGRVQVFDANGKFKTQCLMDAKAPTPSLAADRRGNLFVIQGITITQYDAATCEVKNVFAPALGESYEHIAVGADGNLYATMTGNNQDSIVRFNASGRVTVVVDSAISGQLDNFELDPILALDGQGNFYILGNFARQVFKFDRTGKFIDTIGSRGDEPGQFSAVNSIAVDSQGRIYVGDNKGIQVFSNDGRYLDIFDIPKSVASGMAFDDRDNLWIAAREQVYKLELAKK